MTKELLQLGLELKKLIGSKSIENTFCDYPEGISVEEESDCSWEDEGKYQCGTYIVRVIKKGEPTDLYLSQGVTRYGSYYTEWDYTYDEVDICEKKTELVPITKLVRGCERAV